MFAQNIAFGVAPVVYAALMDIDMRWVILLATVSGTGALVAMLAVARAVRWGRSA
jgi:hypothetical protein